MYILHFFYIQFKTGQVHKGARSEDNNHLADERKGEEMVIGGSVGHVWIASFYFLYDDEFSARFVITHGDVM